MENIYYKAYKEVVEILKYVPEEEVKKIPDDMINMFNIKMDKNYEFKLDENKGIEEQNLLEETKAILANIYEDYWATDEERAEIRKRDREALQKEEEEKSKKYNVDVFAEKRQKKYNNEEQNEKKQLPVVIVKQNFFEKIISFIKNMFKK